MYGRTELPEGELRQLVLRELFDQLAAVMKPLSLITAINGTVVTLIFAQFTEWWLALMWLGADSAYFSYYPVHWLARRWMRCLQMPNCRVDS